MSQYVYSTPHQIEFVHPLKKFSNRVMENASKVDQSMGKQSKIHGNKGKDYLMAQFVHTSPHKIKTVDPLDDVKEKDYHMAQYVFHSPNQEGKRIESGKNAPFVTNDFYVYDKKII